MQYIEPNGPAPPVAQKEFTEAYEAFRYAGYVRQNSRVLEHLASLNLPLRNKSVLEVGAGIGDHTTFFLDRDCRVVSVEPRVQNCQVFRFLLDEYTKAGYRKGKNCTLIRIDAESIDQFVQDTFDIVYCYGLLYHVSNPKLVLEIMAHRCANLFLLETCVSMGIDEAINSLSEPNIPSQAFHGRGCRPTRGLLYSILKTLYPFVYVPRAQPNHELFPVDWTAAAPPPHVLTRAVFVAARQAIVSPLLLDYLPMKQER